VTDPFHDIVESLSTVGDPAPGAAVRIDPDRAFRTGIPEFVLAGSKSLPDIVRAIEALVSKRGRALASRVTPETAESVSAALPDLITVYNDIARVLVVSDGTTLPPSTGGRVGIVSAGTSDRAVAGEAEAVATEMGCDVHTVTDVGVAGLHRLIAPLRDLMAWSPDALVVAAGMDGALPSVIAGLVDVPVIGLPVSTGYGLGGDGTAALYSMLQSCAPGLTVVNIDNGVGAGTTAALIANRVYATRSRRHASDLVGKD
jgi:NCAIR mutase (PurE)-related protein